MSGPLRSTLEQACAEEGLPLKALTVLATQNDPYRIDTPANHRDGAWFAEQLDRLGVRAHGIHLRGLHYKLIGTAKPDGRSYLNTHAEWVWLQDSPADAARWLGYVPFESIEDHRNAAPVVRQFERKTPWPYAGIGGLRMEIPDADDIEPYVGVSGFEGCQPYRLVLFGEKSSLEPVLSRVSWAYETDLFLPTGETSDTLIHRMASAGNEDGRPMLVFTVSDCDPAGWQMPISIGRKLQAFKDLEFPDLDFRVYRVGLLPEQVRDLGLPSAPLKDSEKRADNWKSSMGLEQVEVDAVLALNPQLLENLVSHAIHPFFDRTLKSRVQAAREDWAEEAQEAFEATLDLEALQQIQGEAAEKLAEIEEQFEALRDSVRVEVSWGVELPEIVVPAAEVDESGAGEPLIDSSWSFVEQTQALKASKEYER